MFEQRGQFSRLGRATVLATVAAMALTAAAPSLAFAGPASTQKGVSAAAGNDNGITDVSARARGHRHYRGHAGGAAAAAAFAGIVGTGLAIAASQNRRDYDDEYYGRPAYYGPGPYYGGGPAYYGGGPAYYGGGYRGW